MFDFGLQLKELRTQRGLTQKALAVRINKSKSAIGSYESNRQMPPLEVLISIAAVLHVSLDYLVGFEKSEYYSTKGLTDQQSELLAMLFAEFTEPTGDGEVLSVQQIEIIRKTLQLFQDHSSVPAKTGQHKNEWIYLSGVPYGLLFESINASTHSI